MDSLAISSKCWAQALHPKKWWMYLRMIWSTIWGLSSRPRKTDDMHLAPSGQTQVPYAMRNVPKSRKRKGNVATFSFHVYLHLRCKRGEKLHTFLWRNTPPQQNTFLISFLSSQGETSIYSLPNHLVSNAEVKVISNSIFQNSVFWKTGISDTYKWIISNNRGSKMLRVTVLLKCGVTTYTSMLLCI